MREKEIGHVFLNRMETKGVGGQVRREGMMDREVKDMVKGTPPMFVRNTEVHSEVCSPQCLSSYTTSHFTTRDGGDNSQNEHT